MAELFITPPFIQAYAFCIDDSLPNFQPTRWIQKNRVYKVKWVTPSLNSSELAITILDRNNNEINPSDNVKSFKSERFEFFHVFLN